MKVKMGDKWLLRLKSSIEKYEFEVGVLQDKPYKQPVYHGLLDQPQLKTYAGGPVRKTSRENSGKMISEVFLDNMKRLDINLLQKPFQDAGSDIMKFTQRYLKFVVYKQGNIKRVENLLQAIVRNPILKQEYGENSAWTADSKGFSRHLFDTGQMFKAIVARAVMRVRG